MRLHGGAKKTARSKQADAKEVTRREPAQLSLKFIAYVVAYAVLPTLVRLVYALATREPLPMPPPPHLLERLGWLSPPPVALRRPLPLPAWWQVSIAAAWVGNNIAVMVPGRYDGQAAMAAERPQASTANLFSPSGYAFAIWAPIFLGEWLMMLYLTNVKTPLGAAAAPSWSAATLAQMLWCGAFRPSVCGPALLWVPALLLATTGALLGVAHRAVRATGYDLWGNVLVRWPLTLHFGWITAASLVNFNNWLARVGRSLRTKEIAAHGSVLVALAAATYVSLSTADPIFAVVIAWALVAVAVDGGKAARGLVSDDVLDRVRWSVRAGAGAAALLVVTTATGLLGKS